MKKKLVESSLGIKTTEPTARKLDELIKTLPKNCTFRRRSAVGPVELSSAQRTDVSFITTRAMDRDREIVLPEGIELEDYRANPIVLFGHDQNKPVGKCLWVKATPEGLTAKTRYAERPKNYAGEWQPDFVFEMVKADVLRGKSIGFLPLEMRDPTAEELAEYPDCQNVITRSLLLEYSVVSVPSNPNALVEVVGKGIGWEHWGLKVLGHVKAKQPKPERKAAAFTKADYRKLTPNPERIAEAAVKNLLRRWDA